MAFDRAEFLAAFDAVLARWPVAVESVDVPGPYGTTRVQVCGPRDGAPLVLLHGGGGNSTGWFANVAELSREHRVYAVDQLGSPGRSVPAGQPLTDVDDLLAWLGAVLDQLGVGSAHLCGHSYGGWLALTFALRAPQRVRSLALLDPTDCFARMAPRYLLHAVPLLARPSPARLRAFYRWETGGAAFDSTWLTLAELGTRFPTSKIIMPRRPDPEALRASTTPTLIVLAGQTKVHDLRKVAANAASLLPGATISTLPDASHHTLPSVTPEPLNTLLQEFLARNAG